jgi:hypothetical protein
MTPRSGRALGTQTKRRRFRARRVDAVCGTAPASGRTRAIAHEARKDRLCYVSWPMTRESRNLMERLDDPEQVEMLTEILERLGSIARTMGGAGPLIEALSKSPAVMSDAGARTDYDGLRRAVMGYLASLDESGTPAAAASNPSFVASVGPSERDLANVATAIVSALRRRS